MLTSYSALGTLVSEQLDSSWWSYLEMGAFYVEDTDALDHSELADLGWICLDGPGCRHGWANETGS